MKKQYLISLLGLAAISVPLGSSLLDTNLLVGPVPDPITGTIAIDEENSEVVVLDGKNADSEISVGDTLNSIEMKVVYDNTETDYIIPSKSQSVAFHHGNDDSNFKVSTKDLLEIGEYTPNENGGIYLLDINSEDNNFSSHSDFWNYSVTLNDIENGFKVTTPLVDSTDQKTKWTSIGTVAIKDLKESLKEDSIIQPSDEGVYEISTTSASIDYKIVTGKDNDGNPVTISNVKWIDVDTGKTLATDKDFTGTLTTDDLDEGQLYNTKIVATSSDGNDPEEVVIVGFNAEYIPTNPTINGVSVPVTTETTAQVDFKIDTGIDALGNEDYIEDIVWMNGANTIADKSNIYSSGDITDGTIEAQELNPGTKYKDTKLIVISENGKTDEIIIDDFETRSVAVASTMEIGEVTSRKDSASVSYDITPGLNKKGNSITVKKVTWREADYYDVDSGKTKKGSVLATSTNGKTSGVLRAKDLELYTEYSQTTIEVLMSDGSKINEELDPFTTKSQAESKEITTEVESVDATSATLLYNISKYDDKGEDVNFEVKEVEWITKTNAEVIAKDEEPEFNNSTDSGIIETDKELIPNTSYDTFLKVTIVNYIPAPDEIGVIEKEEILYSDVVFQTNSVEIEQIKNVDVISSNEASVEYNIDLGKNTNRKSNYIEQVRWMNGDTLLASSDSKKTTNTLTTSKLKPDQRYADTTLIVEVSDDVNSVTNEIKTSVDPFKTDKAVSKNSEIKTADEVIVSETNDEATIDFSVTHGKNTDGSGQTVQIEKIEWIDTSNNDVIASEHENSSISNGKTTSGSITATEESGLLTETNYNETILKVTMDDGSSDFEEVIPFSTKTDEVVEPVAPEVSEPTNVYTDTENNKIQVIGEVTPNDGTVTSVELLNKSGKVVATDDSMPKARGDVSYDLVASDYSGNVEDYTIRVNYNDADGSPQKVVSGTIDPKSNVIEEKDLGGGSVDPDDGDKTDKLGAGAVIGIIIAVLLGVGIIAWVGNLLYKKYKENNSEDKKKDKELEDKTKEEDKIEEAQAEEEKVEENKAKEDKA